MMAATVFSAACLLGSGPSWAQSGGSLLPPCWEPALAGDVVMARLVNTSAPRVKGAHDAEFVCVGERAYIVTEANDVRAGESAGWPFIYAKMSVVNLKTFAVEKVADFARGEQRFGNETLPAGACFVPRIIQKDAGTLRCYFTSEDPGKRQSQMWYRDFDVKTGEFAATIHKAMLKTAAGTFDMQPQYFHADAAAQGFAKPAVDSAFFIFDSFKKFDGRTWVALNNFSGKQNALALVHDDLETFEVIGHFNEPQSEQLSEAAVNRLPDGTFVHPPAMLWFSGHWIVSALSVAMLGMGLTLTAGLCLAIHPHAAHWLVRRVGAEDAGRGGGERLHGKVLPRKHSRPYRWAIALPIVDVVAAHAPRSLAARRDFHHAASRHRGYFASRQPCVPRAVKRRRAGEGYQSVCPLPAEHRRRFWLHLLRNLIVKAVIRVGAGYFERGDGFFLIGSGGSGADLKRFTQERIALALRALAANSDLSTL